MISLRRSSSPRRRLAPSKTRKGASRRRLSRSSRATVMNDCGADDVALASVYHNLGGLEHARGNYEAAEPLARRSVELRELALGAKHPDVAADRAALAAIVDALGRDEEAE